MLKLKTLSIKNFMSVGENIQTIDFENGGLTLILGENLDTASDTCVGRNGCGKSAILNALCFGLYGKSLDPDIKRIDALVNNINEKHLMVIIEFEKDGHSYRIERYRKPAKLKFVVDHDDQDEIDESQGENRHTQEEIDHILGISHSLFKHIVALNTSTQPFLSMSAKNQREFIEELLGISQLSEKADILKEDLKETKSLIRTEEIRIQTIDENNKRLEKSIRDLERRSTQWIKNNQEKKEELSITLEELKHLNIEEELANHDLKSEYETLSSSLDNIINQIEKDQKSINRYERSLKKIKEKIDKSKDSTCPTCGQSVHDGKHQSIMDEIEKDRSKTQKMLDELEEDIEKLSQQMIDIDEKINIIGDVPECFYSSKDQAFEHKNSMAIIETELNNITKDQNPYVDQIEHLKKQNLKEIDYEKINGLVLLRDHQEFLYKLLTNKDSFIRKKIIDQNLQYLNGRLNTFLEKLGLPHVVRFMNDLTVDITYLGKDLDFGNLSRGEQTRLILALSWCFRDLFEMINHPINIIFIDELLDNGLDTQGVENAMGIVKREMVHKGGHEAFIISHREELISKIGNVLKVTKQGGFTDFEFVNDYIQ